MHGLIRFCSFTAGEKCRVSNRGSQGVRTGDGQSDSSGERGRSLEHTSQRAGPWRHCGSIRYNSQVGTIVKWVFSKSDLFSELSWIVHNLCCECQIPKNVMYLVAVW